MSNKAPETLNEAQQQAIEAYIFQHFVQQHESDSHREISARTADLGLPQIDVQADEGYFLMWLARLINARQIVEIGTLAGYSSVWLARALPDDGRLFTLELEAKHAAIARQHFSEAGVADKIELRVGVALESLEALTGSYDLLFIDADKENYLNYLRWGLAHIRPGGLITAHNTLRRGAVADPGDNAMAAHLHAYNMAVAKEPRLLSMMFPAGDGTLVSMVLP